jgi:hypothetical protein
LVSNSAKGHPRIADDDGPTSFWSDEFAAIDGSVVLLEALVRGIR